MENVNLLRGSYLDFLPNGWDSPPSSRFPIKVQEKGGQSTPGAIKRAVSKEVTFLVRRGMHGV